MILLFGADWAEWSTYATAWHPIYIPESEIVDARQKIDNMVWPHIDAEFVSFPIKDFKVGKCIGETFGHKDELDPNYIRHNFKTKFFREDIETGNKKNLALNLELRVYENGMYIIFVTIDSERSSTYSHKPFVEYAYNEENERWESVSKNYAHCPYEMIDIMEKQIEEDGI